MSLKTWKLIRDSVELSIPTMLLYVLESKGSSPGRQGFFMAVNASGEMEGSIGGGIMEHKFVELAKERLANTSFNSPAHDRSVRKQIHDKSASKDQSGMICSGEQTILLYELKPPDLETVRNIIASLEKKANGTLVLSPGRIEFHNKPPANDFEFDFRSEKDWLYKEKTGYKNQLFIIGGGHCSLALCKLMGTMDFYIRIYDERNDLKTMTENGDAHEKHVIPSYAALKDMVPSGTNHYVVIMTFGYRTDDVALRALIDKDFAYLGLLGSKNKIEKMFDDYLAGGISEERLRSIHTPIGLPIRSQTPEEIAVSIAAEIIKVKNRDYGHH